MSGATDTVRYEEASDPATGQPAPLGRDFRLLLTAGTISNMGDGVDATALPLLAAALTTDPTLFAGVAVASRVPWLLFALQAGALADRMDRRRLMLTVNVVRAALLGALGLTVLTDTASIWLLYGISFGLGVAEVLFDTSAQALLPRVVRRQQLERANGLQMGAETVANQFVGPPLGGLLFSVAASLPILLDAGTFLVSAGLLGLMSAKVGAIAVRPGVPRAGDAADVADPDASVGGPTASTPRPRVRDEVREGLAWLRAHRLLRSLAILLGLMNGSFMLFGAVFALFALDVLGLGEVGFGLLLTSMALGSVAASVVAGRVVEVVGRSRTLWITLLVSTVLPAVQGRTSSVWVVAVTSVAFGATAVLWNVITVSLRQAVIPDHLLGRVNAVYRFLGWGAMPIGAYAGGLIASAYGLRMPFYVATGVMTVGVLLVGRNITTGALDAAYAAAASDVDDA